MTLDWPTLVPVGTRVAIHHPGGTITTRVEFSGGEPGNWWWAPSAEGAWEMEVAISQGLHLTVQVLE